MSDGSIIFDTSLDNRQLTKELSRLNKKIQGLNNEIYLKQRQKMPLTEQAKQLGALLDGAKAKLYDMQSGQKFYPSAKIEGQKKEIASLQKEWDRVNDRIDRIDEGIGRAAAKAELMKTEAGGIQQRLSNTSHFSELMEKATEKAQKSAQSFAVRMKEVVRSALVFSFITQGLGALREWLEKVIKTNGKATAAIARLKGALLTLAQPIVEVVIPVFIFLINLLTRIASIAASVMSALFGTTAEQSSENAKNLYDQSEALESVGKGAEKAEKSLASFDEINKLSENKSSGGGSSGNSAGTIAPDFTFLDMTEERLDRIAKAVMLIGAGFALWKLGSALPGMLGSVLKTLGGLAIAAGGLILIWDGMRDAWENGVDWDNMAEMILGVAAVTAGLGLAFGAVGAAIGLIIGGIALLITGIGDMMKNGMNLKNLLLTIGGIMAAGIGIALLTGSWIPILIAGIAALLLAIVYFAGEGDALISGLKDIFGGLIDFITGVFTGDWEKAWDGVKRIFKGIWNTILSIVGSVVNLIIDGINWLISKLNTISFSLPDWVPGIGGKSYGINISPVAKWEIPYLAQGAVIPPNREFMAVLGDQKNGTNIETPLATMIEAFKQAMADTGYGAGSEAVLVIDGEVFGRLAYRLGNKEARRKGVSLVEGKI